MDAWLAWFREEETDLIHRLRYSNGALTPVLRGRCSNLRRPGVLVLLACIQSSQISRDEENNRDRRLPPG